MVLFARTPFAAFSPPRSRLPFGGGSHRAGESPRCDDRGRHSAEASRDQTGCDSVKFSKNHKKVTAKLRRPSDRALRTRRELLHGRADFNSGGLRKRTTREAVRQRHQQAAAGGWGCFGTQGVQNRWTTGSRYSCDPGRLSATHVRSLERERTLVEKQCFLDAARDHREENGRPLAPPGGVIRWGRSCLTALSDTS